MKFISPILSDARASVGGATFSKNRGGNYVRAKVAPVQPRTASQQAARSNLATLSAMWRGLTTAEIAGWNALASTLTLHDSLGVAYKPTGAQLFVGNNRNLSDALETVVSVPPASAPTYEDLLPIAAAAAAAAATFVLTTAAGAAPTGFVFLVRATAQSSPGRSYFGRSAYRNIGAFAASSFASLNIKAAYVAKFGALAAGSQIAVGVSLVQISSGFKSIEATTTCIVAA